MAAFRLAFHQNADGIELDIHLARGEKIVVIHDEDTFRTAGVAKRIVNHTLPELRELNVGNFGKWKAKACDEKIPTLDEVFAIIPEGRKLYIELKVHREILLALEQSLKRAPTMPDQTVIMTFLLETAAAAKQKFPDRKVYWLVGKDENKKFPSIDDIVSKAKGKVDGVDLDHAINLDAAAIEKIHGAGLSCHVWTLDDATKAKTLISMGVDSITTNRPGALRAEIAKRF